MLRCPAVPRPGGQRWAGLPGTAVRGQPAISQPALKPGCVPGAGPQPEAGPVPHGADPVAWQLPAREREPADELGGCQENQGEHQETCQRGVQVSGGFRPGDLGDGHGEHEHAENGDHDAPPFRWPRAARCPPRTHRRPGRCRRRVALPGGVRQGVPVAAGSRRRPPPRRRGLAVAALPGDGAAGSAATFLAGGAAVRPGATGHDSTTQPRNPDRARRGQHETQQPQQEPADDRQRRGLIVGQVLAQLRRCRAIA